MLLRRSSFNWQDDEEWHQRQQRLTSSTPIAEHRRREDASALAVLSEIFDRLLVVGCESHGNLPDDPLSLSMDVGVDSHDFRPWHFDEIQAVMKVKAEAKAKHIEMRKLMAEREES
jgi:hypothetical protein